MPAKLRVTLVKSPIGHTARTHGTLRALGLRRVGQTVEVDDNAQMRGLARTVRFLVRTEEVAAAPAATVAKPAPAATAAKPTPAATAAKPTPAATAAKPTPARRAPRRSKKDASE